MPSNEKIIYVYDSFTFDKPKLLGKLYVDAIKCGENYSFEYDNEWLASTNYPVSIDPDFFGYGGRQYPNGRSIFGIFADASPDRWGRLLMMKKERKLADKEARKPMQGRKRLWLTPKDNSGSQNSRPKMMITTRGHGKRLFTIWHVCVV